MSAANLAEYSAQDLLDELRARGGPRLEGIGPESAPSRPRGLNPSLAGVSAAELVRVIKPVLEGIYGVDDRLDYWQISIAAVQDRVEAVAALAHADNLVDRGDGTWQLPIDRFQTAYQLCDGEPFGDQPCPAFGTAFLVGKDLIATAGHCVSDYRHDPGKLRVVFGFRMVDPVTAVTRIPAVDVYRGAEIVGYKLAGNGSDWALVRLDREVKGRPTLRIRRTGKIGDEAPVYVIGHPCGLPVKYADGANVRDNTGQPCFSANLDTYGGNSGSPVFNADHEVEGILVRGGPDFVWQGACRVSVVQPVTGGGGEDVTRTTEFAHLVPMAG